MERATYLHRANTNPTLHNFTRGNLRSSLSEPRKREGEKIETVTLFFRIIWSKLQMETALHDAAASLQPRSQISETTGRACVCEHESSSASPPFALTEDKCQRAEREARGERRRGCRIVRASRTKRKRKSETRIGLIKASKQCRGCRRWLNNVWLAKSPYGT